MPFVAPIAAAVLACAPAVAGPLRAPVAGAPALQIDAPPEWKTKRVDLFGASVAVAYLDDRSGMVAIAMIPSGDAAPPLRVIVQAVAGAPVGANAQSSPASLDGRAAEAFTSTQPPKGSQPERHVRYVIARLDDHHVALVFAITNANAPVVERQLIEDAAAKARVIDAAPHAK